MKELNSEVTDLVANVGGIAQIWDRGKRGEDLKEHHQFLLQGMNYWNETREMLKVLFRQNRQKMTDLSSPNFAATAAYRHVL